MTEEDLDLSKKFVTTIRRLQKQMKIETDSDILTKVDISQSRFSQLMSNKAMPSIKECMRLAKFFNTTIDGLFARTDDLSNKSISYADLTTKDVLPILIDLYDIGYINLLKVESPCELVNDDIVTTTEYGIALTKNSHVGKILNDWKAISDSIDNNPTLINKDKMKDILRQEFIASLKERNELVGAGFMCIPSNPT